MSSSMEVEGGAGAVSSAAAAPAAAAAAAAAASSRYVYAVTAQPPTLVSHTVVCSFTGGDDRNLLLVRSSRLDMYRVTGDGLESVASVPLFARVAAIHSFRARNDRTDRLFIATERHTFFVLRWDAERKEIVTVATGSSKLKIGRSSDQGCLALFDPSSGLLGLHQYDGLLQVASVDAQSGAISKELHECKLEPLAVVQLTWLRGQSKPTLLVLAADHGTPTTIGAHSGEQRRLRSYTYEAREKELKAAPHVVNLDRCDNGASHIMATEFGGAIVVAEESITYVPVSGRSSVQLQISPWMCTACCAIDRDRFLLADVDGGLHVLMLVANSAGDAVMALKLEFLGVTSIAHKLQYIDGGLVMVGSIYGDSQLIRLHQQPVPLETEANDAEDDAAAMDIDAAAAPSSSAAAAAAVDKRPNYISIENTFDNLGPIVDFAMLDLDRNGQGAMLTCSGAYKDGSLRVVRNGIGVREEAAIELPGIQGVWSLKDPAAPAGAATDAFDKLLVQTFATETRVLALEADEEEESDELQLAECEIAGFDANQRTLLCANLAGGLLLQVTPVSCRLVDGQSMQLVDEWRLPADALAAAGAAGKITVASANSAQVLLGAGRVLLLLTLNGRKLQLHQHITMDQEISCVDITPLGGAATATVAAVCMWRDYTVRVLRTSNLEEVARERLGDTVARSVLFAQFDAPDAEASASASAAAPSYLLCGLGDGNLISFQVQTAGNTLTGRKKIAIGTSGIELRRFVSLGVSHVFLSCDRPTVVSSANGRLLVSNVNVPPVSHMAPFHAPVFKDCLALVSSTQLMIGHIDDIQKLHIKKVRTDGQPRRLAHHASSQTLAVVVMERAPIDLANDLTGEVCKIKLFDDKEFACLHEIALKTNETALAIASVNLNPHANAANYAASAAAATGSAAISDVYPEYLLVGTAFMNPEEPEPSAGRLLLLAVDASSGRPSLRVVCEASVRGGVFAVTCIQGRIVAGVNASVVVYRCVSTGVLGSSSAASASSAEGACRIEKECDFAGNVLVLHLVVSHDQQYVIVGDMMKSVCVLHYSSSLSGSGVQSAHGASSLSEVARDYESHWLTAMSSFSSRDDICIFADHHFNLVTLRRQTDAATEEERGRMECVGRWHSGEMINKIARGSLVMQLPDDATENGGGAAGASNSSASFDRVVPTHVYGSITGAVGVLAPLTSTTYKFFARLEEELEKVVRGVGNLSHREWRAFHNDRRTEESKGFIDGDLVECFLELQPRQQEEIARKLDVPLSECIKRVEDVQRIH